MKKLAKNLLALTLSFILVASTLVTGLVAIAETPAYFGTEEDGFSSVLSSYPNRLTPADGIYNLDFENGFVYWSGQKFSDASIHKSILASDNFMIAENGGNKYITLKEDGYVSNVQTAFFKASNLQVGDKVVLIYDAKGKNATTLRPYLRQDGLRPVEYDENGLSTTLNPNGNGKLWNASAGTAKTIVGTGNAPSVCSLQLGAKGWTTYVTSYNMKIQDPTTITSGARTDIFLQVCIGKDSSAGNNFDAAIDNIRIAKVVNNVYYDVATGEEIKEPATRPDYGDDDGTDDGPTVPAYYGTEADGFSSILSSWPCRLKPAEGLQNLDFEQGFIYWSGEKYESIANSNVFASDNFKLVEDGTNKYITLKDNGYVSNSQTILFKVSNLAVGDEIAIVYDAKGQDPTALRPYVRQDGLRPVEYDANGMSTTYKEGTTTIWNPSGGSAKAIITTSSYTPLDISAQSGWTTYVSGTGILVDPTTLTTGATSDIYLQICIAAAPGAGTDFDAAIDNIRIAKVVNGIYTDITTGKVLYDSTVAEAEVSSIEITTSPKTEYLQNEKIDLTNATLLVKYADGTQRTINMTRDMVSGYNSRVLGQQTVTVTYRDVTTTFSVNVAFDPSGELSADTLVWLIGVIVADDTDNDAADFNSDGKVNLLDLVYVKKEIAKEELNKTPIDGPMYTPSSEDVYSNQIVRYELHNQCKGYYFAPKAEGKYQTVVLIHGQGGVGTFRDRLLSSFNKWVKEGYIEPMVVVIPEVYDYEGNGYNINDFQYYMYEEQTNRFPLLLKNIENAALCSKIDTSKQPFVAGFSMGGMASLHAGAEYNTRIKCVGGLSPSSSFYLGDGNWGIYNYAADIHYSEDKDALVYLAAGMGEGTGVKDSINRFETAIAVNDPKVAVKYLAPESWGGHSWPLAQKEIFMFLCLATHNRFPTETLVESACNPNAYTTPTIVNN